MDEYQQSALEDSSSSRSVSEVRSWLERLTRRSLNDVRVHDSSQAGQLARRLGARAFAAGRHVYVRPELVKPLTPEGTALLAHEMWHAAGEPEIVAPPITTAHSGTLAGMPLLSSAGMRGSHGEHGPGSGPGAGGVSEPGQGQAASVPIQRASATGTGSEAVAQSVEAAALQEQSRSKEGGEEAGAKGFDPEEVAEKVYRLFQHDLIIDRERTAYS